MNDRQENKLTMYETVQETMAANVTITAAVPAIAPAVAALGAEITTIQTLSQTQKQPTKGATKSKSQLRGAMADAAVPVASALKALASATGNAELAAQANFTRTDFVFSRDTVAPDNAVIVKNLAIANLAALANYGAVQSDIDALAAAITAYNASITRPRQVVTLTKAATKQLEEAFARADVILNDQLDNLIEKFRLTQPAFYLAFQSARVIVDTASPPGPAPTPVTLTFTFNEQLPAGVFHWTASTHPQLAHYQLRVSSSQTYNAATAVVVDNAPPGTLSLTTIHGLENPGDEASYTLFVMLASGHEAGSNTITFTRPTPP